jgi:hypothetical protein
MLGSATTVKITSHAKEYKSRLMQGVDNNVEAAAIMYERGIVEALSVGAVPPPKRPRGAPSEEGEYPRAQTKRLRTSINHVRVNQAHWRVGSTLRPQGGSEHSYAWWLEFRPPRKGGRPFWRPVLMRMRSEMIATCRRKVRV